jgi:hypothetical protein
MFLHQENQDILSAALQKTPYYVEFVRLYPQPQRVVWWHQVIEQFAAAWLAKGHSLPHSKHELLEMNKHALHYVLADIKQMVQPVCPSSPSLGAPSLAAASSAAPLYAYETPSVLPSHNVAAAKQQREDQWKQNFEQYQSEYNALLAAPAVPNSLLPFETPDAKIRNMDELMMQQKKRRDMDMAVFAPPPPVPPPIKLAAPSPFGAPSAAGAAPRLKILDTIERAEIEHSISVANDRKAKAVSWLDQSGAFPYEPSANYANEGEGEDVEEEQEYAIEEHGADVEEIYMQ